MSNKETMQERLARLKQEKEQKKETVNSSVLSQLTHEEDSTPDFDKMTEEFKKIQANQEPGANEKYRKDTLYIKDSLYSAFNALCINRGDKKRYANEAPKLKSFHVSEVLIEPCTSGLESP